MPLLPDPRDERFAQERAKGATQIKAYTAAGFPPDDGHASRLNNRPDVKARINELLEAAAERTIVTIYDIADQLDEDRAFARECEAPGAAITATMGKAKVLGLLTERIEHTGADGGPIQMGDTELARLIVFQLQKAQREAG